MNLSEVFHLNNNGELILTKNGKSYSNRSIVKVTINKQKYNFSVSKVIWYLESGENYPAQLYVVDKSKGRVSGNLSKDYPYITRNHKRELPKHIYKRESKKNGSKYEVIVFLNRKLYNVGIFYDLDDAINARDFVLKQNIPYKMSGKLHGQIVGDYHEV